MDFSYQILANTAWACATVGHNERVLSTLAAAAERCMIDINSRSLANTAFPFARMNVSCQRWKLLLWRMMDFNSQNLANTAWALTDSAALHARELLKRSCRGGSWGGWVIIVFANKG